MKKNKKNTIKKVAPLALIGCLAVGGLGASAWLSTSDVDDVKHTITAGTFELTLSGDVGFENKVAYPVSDAVGKAQTATYDAENNPTGVILGSLTVTNSGEVNQVIRLAIDDEAYNVDTNANGYLAGIDESLINLYITAKDGENDVVVYEGTLADANKEKGFGAVKVLNSGDAVNYTVRLWIDDAAVNSDIYEENGDAKQVQFKLAVLGVQLDGGIFSDVANVTVENFENAANNANLTR